MSMVIMQKTKRKGVIGSASAAASVVGNARFVEITEPDQHDETNQSGERKAAHKTKA